MSDKQSSYRNIVKSTSIFGGVQVFQILINLIEAKCVAAFLGTKGVGISGIFTATLAIVNAIAGLGLSYGATRQIAQAIHDDDLSKLERVCSIFEKLLYFTSVTVCILMIFIAKPLSNYAFGNSRYSSAFIWLSCTIILTTLTNKNTAILQGTRKLKYMARSTMIGALIGLITSVPMYYFLGTSGIVPTQIVLALCAFLVSQFFVKQLKLKTTTLTVNEVISSGKEMVSLGIVMMIATLMGTIVTFSVNTFIGKVGSLGDVGLYNSGISITSQFIGLVFTALSMDYYPRLSAISSDNDKVRQTVNQQSEVALLIILPLLILMIITTPLLVNILLTPEFLPVIPFVRIVAFGAIFQASSYTISYIPLAKGDTKVYFYWNALFCNVLGVVILCVGYKLQGITGLAFALLSHHLISFFVFIVLNKKKYNYVISRFFLTILLVSVFLVGSSLYIATFLSNLLLQYTFNGLLLLLAAAFSVYQLDKILDLKKIFDTFKSKYIQPNTRSK